MLRRLRDCVTDQGPGGVHGLQLDELSLPTGREQHRSHLHNVGQFHLCTWLQEQPSGETYENLDGICGFEVIRVDGNQIGGWRPQICTYHEQHAWQVVDATSTVEV